MAWLQVRKQLSQAVLIPVDAHLGLFGPTARGPIAPGQRRCDLALIGLRRGIVDASFIEVKWRRGPLGDVADLVEDMGIQMRMTGETFATRFFNTDRVDGALQRAYLATVLRFYCRRAQRYGLLDAAGAATLPSYVAQLEKPGWSFRPTYQGYIVSLEDPGRRPIVQGDLVVRVLNAQQFQQGAADLLPEQAPERLPELPHPSGNGQQTEAPDLVSQVQAAGSADAAERTPRDEGGLDGIASSMTTLRDEEQEAPQPVAMTEVARTELSIGLGESGGREIVWKPGIQGSPHLFIAGLPGQGKSWTVLRLLTELSRQDVPALVFDFHGQLAAADGQYVQVAGPLITDAALGLPFSPFECADDSSALGWYQTALGVSEIIGYVCGLGEMQRDALFTSIRDAYRSYGFGSPDESTSNPTEYPSLEDISRRVEHAERQRNIQNLLARCRPLLEMNIFRPPVGAQRAFEEALWRGLVVDLHRLASEMLQLAAGAFLLRKVYRDMFLWGNATQLRLAVVLDEAHRLARDVTLPKIMKEGRKFGVFVIAASQGLADFHPDVLGNAGTRVAFRTNYPDSRRVAGFFQGRHGQDLAGALQSLSVGEALVQTPEMQFVARTRMWAADPQL